MTRLTQRLSIPKVADPPSSDTRVGKKNNDRLRTGRRSRPRRSRMRRPHRGRDVVASPLGKRFDIKKAYQQKKKRHLVMQKIKAENRAPVKARLEEEGEESSPATSTICFKKKTTLRKKRGSRTTASKQSNTS